MMRRLFLAAVLVVLQIARSAADQTDAQIEAKFSKELTALGAIWTSLEWAQLSLPFCEATLERYQWQGRDGVTHEWNKSEMLPRLRTYEAMCRLRYAKFLEFFAQQGDDVFARVSRQLDLLERQEAPKIRTELGKMWEAVDLKKIAGQCYIILITVADCASK